jgi:hypothetical protein
MPNERTNELYVKARQAEMMRAAQRHRLAADGRLLRPRAERFHIHIFHLALAWFGRSLAALGQGLRHKAKFPAQADHG